ncbi:MAG TPA: antibiotic biosynthesis monooxygenase [Candidatus Acidoferrales bacterium]|nr:antibiotic biosynthesis monooxygenase [Candidatus Acidoferrales bacterium]
MKLTSRVLIILFAALLSFPFATASHAQAPGDKLYVVTHVDLTPNNVEDGTKLLQQFAADSRHDPGVVRFELLEDNDRHNHFTLVEVWENFKAFEAHEAAEHTKIFREKLQPMLGSPFDERLHHIMP